MESNVRDAQSKGTEILIGGQRLTDLGSNFYSPTVLTKVTVDMQISNEETFGPVAGLCSFETKKEVIGFANNTPTRLAGYLTAVTLVESIELRRHWK